MSQAGRIRAPRVHGAVESAPALTQLSSAVAANRTLLNQPKPPILGRDWLELRRAAAEAALQAAVAYHARLGQPVEMPASRSLVMAGHQPELFHPGVWVKNFALNGLARETQSTALNLVVDNDAVKATTLRLPVQTDDHGSKLARVVQLPFDQRSIETPYEEYAVRDEELFRSLPERATAYTSAWGFEPFLKTFWSELVCQAERTDHLGERIACARRHFERAWGCLNLEIPVSDLNRTGPFAWFACHILDRLSDFRTHYNQSVEAYRHQYGIRSRSHPVPNLASEGDWLETPFWSWEHGQTRRDRLFARLTPDQIELRSGPTSWPTLPRENGASSAATVLAYQDLNRRGLQIRCRALVNTLYCRLFLGDYFLHGIGGGKYDEVTDALARAFYGIEPPAYGVLTATLLLPIRHFPATVENMRRLARRLRDLEYNPERFLGEAVKREKTTRRLIEEKNAWVHEVPISKAIRKQRFHALRTANAKLAALLDDDRAKQKDLLARSRAEVAANAILDSRDYAFCLYPEEMLREFLCRFLRA
ncbi:MAG TPA: hypothetical protein VGP68_19560 [Gemmataceae bacterium]|nr:hypothetical protein [Gemmataceae bacterium]